MVGRPVQVPSPLPTPEPTRPALSQRPPSATSGIRITPGMIWLGVAAFLVIVFTLWALAYKLGGQKKLDDVKELLIDPSKPVTNPQLPLNAQGGTSGNTPNNPQPPTVQSDPTPEPVTTDPRKPGNNYLHVVLLVAKEADRAVAYLTKSGVPAFAVPDKKYGKIDPAEARAKNDTFLIFVLEPVPSDQFKASERKRTDLIEKVRQIGKKWQREEKGPSDFGEPSWARFN